MPYAILWAACGADEDNPTWRVEPFGEALLAAGWEPFTATLQAVYWPDDITTKPLDLLRERIWFRKRYIFRKPKPPTVEQHTGASFEP